MVIGFFHVILGLLPDPSTYYITVIHTVLLKSWNIHDNCLIKNPGLIDLCQTASAEIYTAALLLPLHCCLFSVLPDDQCSAHSWFIIYLPALGQQLAFCFLSSLKPCVATWSCHFTCLLLPRLLRKSLQKTASPWQHGGSGSNYSFASVMW